MSKVQINLSLDKFIDQNSNAFSSMHNFANHVGFQLPKNHTHMTYLLDRIKINDATLQAYMDIVVNDNGT